MTGLFLSEYVRRRDGWCINTCLGKLYRTCSPELGLCYLLKLHLSLQMHLIYVKQYICIACNEQLHWDRVTAERFLYSLSGTSTEQNFGLHCWSNVQDRIWSLKDRSLRSLTNITHCVRSFL